MIPQTMVTLRGSSGKCKVKAGCSIEVLALSAGFRLCRNCRFEILC